MVTVADAKPIIAVLCASHSCRVCTHFGKKWLHSHRTLRAALGRLLLDFLRAYSRPALSVPDPFAAGGLRVDLGRAASRFPFISHIFRQRLQRLSERECLSDFIDGWPEGGLLKTDAQLARAPTEEGADVRARGENATVLPVLEANAVKFRELPPQHQVARVLVGLVRIEDEHLHLERTVLDGQDG